ncbi:MAG: hypothetical protein QXD23_03160, partial [Candidatus Micrarchaeaceae archaeon]
HFVYLSQINNKFNSSYILGLYEEFSPVNYTISNNKQIEFNMTLKVDENSTENTYMVHVDGPCGGGIKPFLITIGNKQYTGNVNVTVMPFA